MMLRSWLVFLVVVLCGGCVFKSKYEALEDKLSKTKTSLQGQIKQHGETIKGCKAELAKKEARIKELDAEVASLKAKIAKLEQANKQSKAEVSTLEGKLASLIKDRSRLKQSAKELKAAMAEISKRKAEAELRVKQFRDLLARFKSLIDAGKLKVKIADGRMVLELPTDVLFASGSAKLSEAGVQSISEVTAVLVTLTDRRFQVEGHTDNVPIKTARYRSNWELAAFRALGVVQAMMDAGMSGNRISAASFSEHRPVAANDSDLGKAANRRIEIVVVPDLSSLPGFDELQKAVSGK